MFPKANTKKTSFSANAGSSVRCGILHGKQRCLKILRKTFLEFAWRGSRRLPQT